MNNNDSMFKYFALLVACGTITASASAQPALQPVSIHQLEAEGHGNDRIENILFLKPAEPLAPHGAPLSRRVFGYHPYWAGAEDHLKYDYSALSTIGYFSATVDTVTGSFSSVRSWRTTPLISYAHERGVKVVLVVTSFGNAFNDAILGNPVKRGMLITTIVNEVKNAGGDGVNIDFEQVRASQRANMVAFMSDLASALRGALPGAEVSMATPAVDWSNAFDLAELSKICDYLVLMGYDYHWSSAPTAGPVAPLAGESYNVTRSVDTYLAVGVAPEKLLLGVPWYGYDWRVVDTNRMAATRGTGTAVTYKVAEPAAQVRGKLFDAATGTAWYRYAVDTVQHQAWYDDSLSLSLKYGLVKSRGLGGIGIWALSYEGGRPEIWNGITQAFQVPSGVDLVENSRNIIRIYPNPARESLHVTTDLMIAGDVSMTLVNALGQSVWRGEVENGNMLAEIDIRRLPAGSYLLLIHNGFRQYLHRIVVAH
jgi:spore germination protein YaaH